MSSSHQRLTWSRWVSKQEVKFDGCPADAGRFVTVSGKEIWQGPAAVDNLSPGLIARLDVPAMLLLVDDYVITLFEVSEGGVEQERARYFMSVRAR